MNGMDARAAVAAMLDEMLDDIASAEPALPLSDWRMFRDDLVGSLRRRAARCALPGQLALIEQIAPPQVLGPPRGMVYVFLREGGHRGLTSYHHVDAAGNAPLCGAAIAGEHWRLVPVRRDRSWGEYMCARCRALWANT